VAVYYFFSGFDKDKGFSPEIGQSLRECITARKSLLFIASSPSAHEKTDFYINITINLFRNIGVEFENYDVLDDRKPKTEYAELLKNACAVFLCGGTTLLQIDFLRKNDLIPLLKQSGGVIMGVSAGAINMAVTSFYSADKDHGQTHTYEGIGLADISVEPHFSIENTVLLEKELLPFSEKTDIYAMCDGSAIKVCDGKREYFGDIYLISKGNVKQL